jgi:cobalt/nickel transport system permease protein
VSSLETGIYELGRFDQLATMDSAVHRLDPRAKVLATLVFIVCVVSFHRYEVTALAPFALFPVVLAAEGGIPADAVLRRLLVASPFALAVGIFNPLLDRNVIGALGALEVTGGWVSFASIMARFALTAGTALVLVAITGMPGVASALERLGAPKVFATQLLFLYRYIFVLAEEAMRMTRARSLRSFGGRGMELRPYVRMLGQLLLRTYGRARRVYDAMLCRGFDGEVRSTAHLRFTPRDWMFLLGWSGAFVVMRVFDLPDLLGRLMTGLIG